MRVRVRVPPAPPSATERETNRARPPPLGNPLAGASFVRDLQSMMPAGEERARVFPPRGQGLEQTLFWSRKERPAWLQLMLIRSPRSHIASQYAEWCALAPPGMRTGTLHPACCPLQCCCSVGCQHMCTTHTTESARFEGVGGCFGRNCMHGAPASHQSLALRLVESFPCLHACSTPPTTTTTHTHTHAHTH